MANPQTIRQKSEKRWRKLFALLFKKMQFSLWIFFLCCTRKQAKRMKEQIFIVIAVSTELHSSWKKRNGRWRWRGKRNYISKSNQFLRCLITHVNAQCIPSWCNFFSSSFSTRCCRSMFDWWCLFDRFSSFSSSKMSFKKIAVAKETNDGTGQGLCDYTCRL